MRKLLCLLLAVLMVVSLLSVSAFADKFGDGDEGSIPMKATVEGTKQYTVNAAAYVPEFGTVTGGGTYDEGTVITVTAIPAPGNYFFRWIENDVWIDNVGINYTFTVTSDRNLFAVFATESDPEYKLNVEENEYFTITTAPDKSVCNEQEIITVTAAPKHGGVKFDGWLKGRADEQQTLVSTDASYSFEIRDDTYLSVDYSRVQAAVFEPGLGNEGYFFVAGSENANKEVNGHVFYTSDGPDDLKLHFPPADCFTAPEGKVFDCWEKNGNGYEAGSVQTVIGEGANSDFSGEKIYVTAKWKDDDSKTLKCVISVPALIDIPYKQEFTSVPWSVDSLELGAYGTAWITFYDGSFQTPRGDTFRYLIKDLSEPDEVSSYKYSVRRPEEHTIQVCISNETWEEAAPGEYTATMRFDVKGVY